MTPIQKGLDPAAPVRRRALPPAYPPAITNALRAYHTGKLLAEVRALDENGDPLPEPTQAPRLSDAEVAAELEFDTWRALQEGDQSEFPQPREALA